MGEAREQRGKGYYLLLLRLACPVWHDWETHYLFQISWCDSGVFDSVNNWYGNFGHAPCAGWCFIPLICNYFTKKGKIWLNVIMQGQRKI